MKKKTYYILLPFVFIIGILICRVIILHQKYPDPIIETFGYGDTIELENHSITFSDWTWGNATDLSEKYPDIDFDYIEYGDDFRYGLIELTMMKKSDSGESYDLSDISFSSGAWANRFDMELFYLLNPELGNMNASEKQQVFVLPMTMLKSQFTDSQWKQIDDQIFYIDIQFYPTHLRFEMKPSNNE